MERDGSARAIRSDNGIVGEGESPGDCGGDAQAYLVNGGRVYCLAAYGGADEAAPTDEFDLDPQRPQLPEIVSGSSRDLGPGTETNMHSGGHSSRGVPIHPHLDRADVRIP